MRIFIGPSGAGLVNRQGLELIKKEGLDALEIAFTYRVFLNEKEAEVLGKLAKSLGIVLSVHASYYINLSSLDRTKIDASIKRILQSVKIGNILNAKYVVFHAGYYGKLEKEKVYDVIKSAIKRIKDVMNTKGYNKVLLAPETTGKISQFGTLNELVNLSNEFIEQGDDIAMCVDFAHIYARNIGKIDYDDVLTKIKKSKYYRKYKHIHCHFSGIKYGLKGEREHLITKKEDILKLLTHIKKHKINCTIINESPQPLQDSIKTKRILEEITQRKIK